MSVFDLEATISLNSSNYKSQLKDAANYTDNTARTLDARTVAIGNVISDLAKKGGEFFVDMAKTGIQYNAQIETYTTALTTALGDEAAAAAAIENIKQDAARTPYSVDGLVKANSYLIAAGESAGDARDTVMALGDAVAATGGGNAELQNMARNLQQIKNVGKATSMDIRQFQTAGVEVYGLLADYTGKTKEEVQGMTITYDLLAGALQYAAGEGGKFYGSMQRQSETLNGQISTLQDNVKSKLGEAFNGVADTLSGTVLPNVNKFVDSLDFSNAEEKLEGLAKVAGTVGAAFSVVAVAKFANAIADIGTNAAVTAKYLNLAAKAQQLWNAAQAASPYMAVAGIMSVAAVATIDYANSIDAAVASQRNYGETSSEVASRLAEVQAEYNNWKEAAENGATEYNVYETMMLLEQEIAALETRYDELKAKEEGAAEGAEGVAEGAETAAEGLDGLTESTDETVAALADIITNYNKLHENITKKVKSWFGLFDEAKTSVKTNVSDMMKNMQSQIDFNTSYSNNLTYLANNGLSDLGAAFQNMGADGAAYADAIVSAIETAGGATSDGGQEIIQNFQALSEGVSSSQTELSNSLTNITGTLDGAFAEWGASAEQAAEALNQAGAAGTAAAETVNAYIAGIAAGAGGAGAAAASVARAAAAGFGAGGSGGGSGRPVPTPLAVGSDYIPYDNFPALLHKGEMVIPAKISEDLRDFLGAGQQPSSQGTPYTGGSGGGAISEVVGLLRELIVATSRPVVLDSGRLVGGIGSAMNNELGDMDELGRRGVSFA